MLLCVSAWGMIAVIVVLVVYTGVRVAGICGLFDLLICFRFCCCVRIYYLCLFMWLVPCCLLDGRDGAFIPLL